MVSNDLLLHIHLRLVEICACPNNTPFAEITVIAVGNFLQLPPVRARPVYAEYNNSWQNLDPLWETFEIAEPTEVMRQRGDDKFIDLLNHVRTAALENNDVSLLKSTFVRPSDTYPKDTLHIFAENAPANTHNMTMLNSTESELYKIQVVDNIPKSVASSKIDQALNSSQSETGGVAGALELKIDARIMVTVNIDLNDMLVNGQLGTVKHILKDQKGSVTKIYVAFDDNQAGLKNMSKDAFFASQNLWVPIEKAKTNIRIRSNKDQTSPVINRTQFPLMLAWR